MFETTTIYDYLRYSKKVFKEKDRYKLERTPKGLLLLLQNEAIGEFDKETAYAVIEDETKRKRHLEQGIYTIDEIKAYLKSKKLRSYGGSRYLIRSGNLATLNTLFDNNMYFEEIHTCDIENRGKGIASALLKDGTKSAKISGAGKFYGEMVPIHHFAYATLSSEEKAMMYEFMKENQTYLSDEDMSLFSIYKKMGFDVTYDNTRKAVYVSRPVYSGEVGKVEESFLDLKKSSPLESDNILVM